MIKTPAASKNYVFGREILKNPTKFRFPSSKNVKIRLYYKTYADRR